jgi:hypothetical protein
MTQSKIDFHKEDGIQYKHLIQSFADYDEITPEMAYEIGINFYVIPCLMAFRYSWPYTGIKNISTFTMSSTPSIPIPGESGIRRNKIYTRLRIIPTPFAGQHNLVVIPAAQKGKSLSDGEYRSVRKGASWKKELWLAVSHCIEHSVSRKDLSQR